MNQTLLMLGKASLLLSVALLVAPLLGRAPAATRHRLWTALFAAVLALPLLAMVLPALDVPVRVGREAAAAQPPTSGRVIAVQAPAGGTSVDHGRATASAVTVP